MGKRQLGFRRASAASGLGMFGRAAYNTYMNRNRMRLGIQSRNRFGGSRTGTMTRNRQSSGQGVTTQHDRRQVYRKRSMPRYKKRRWKKFVNKIHAVAERDYGSRTWLANNSITQTLTLADTQGVLTLALYSQQSSNPWLNDLNSISALENFQGNPTTAAGITVENSTKVLFQSAILDVTIRNISTLITGVVPFLDGRAKLELDVYEMSATKDFMVAAGSYGSLGVLFNAIETDIKILNNSGTSITIGARGATPFELPYVLGRFGLKVWKKTKFFIPNSDTITYQVRDPKRHVTTIGDLKNENGANRPKWTRFLLLIYKLVPGLTIGAIDGTYQPSIAVGATRKYFYKLEGANDDRDRYDTNSTVLGGGAN